MVKIKSILLPTDFSKYAAEATNYACELASQFGSKLHVLHVLPDPAAMLPDFEMGLDFSEISQRIPESFHEQLELDALKRLAKVLDPEWQKGKSVVLATKEGLAHIEIIGYAKSHLIDLIVMGTHGRTGLSHALIGSVAERVVRTAPCPVLCVRSGQHQFVAP